MKKGSFSVVIVLILAAFIAILFLTVMFKITKGLDRQSKADACRTSLLYNEKARLIKEMQLVGVDCPKDEVTYTAKDMKKYGSVSEGVKRTLAEEMRLCWYKGGRGNLSAFEKSLTEDDRVCMICSQIDFDENVEKELTDETDSPFINHFASYLVDTPILGATDPEQTYVWYLTNGQVSDEEKRAIRERLITLSNDITLEQRLGGRTYYTVFALDKTGSKVGGAIGGGALGFSASTAGGIAALWLLPDVSVTKILAAYFTLTEITTTAGVVVGYLFGAANEDYSAASILVKKEDFGKLGCTRVIQ